MILVTHDLDLAAAFADRAVYLEAGKLRDDGPADSVVARYRSDVAGELQDEPDERRPVRIVEEGRRWGNGDVEILSVEIFSASRRTRLIPSGEECEIRIRYRCRKPVRDFVFGIAWHGAEGNLIAGHNTGLDGLAAREISGEGEVNCIYPALPLTAGNYELDVAVHAADGLAYDYWCGAASLQLSAPVQLPGVWAPEHHWSASGEIWK